MEQLQQSAAFAAPVAEVRGRSLPPGARSHLKQLRSRLQGSRGVYLSTPITTGERLLEWRKLRGPKLDAIDEVYARELKSRVIDENLRQVRPLRRRLSTDFPGREIIDPTELEADGWSQSDYHRYWLEVLGDCVDVAVFANGWHYSTGCTLEYGYAVASGIRCLDADLRKLEPGRAAELLSVAADQMQLAHLPSNTAIAVAAWLGSASRPRGGLKDEVLAALARTENVAIFASFSPGEPRTRFVLDADPVAVESWTVDQAVSHVLSRSRSGTVNVRTFREHESKSSPFIYGLGSVPEVVALVREHAAAGYYSIVNETIDVSDGGVSGVSLGGVLEFAPDGTPRVVEQGGTASLSVALGRRLLSEVYGGLIEIPSSPSRRYEFSVHPQRVGHRKAHVLVWEAEDVEPVSMPAATWWPNNFSRLLGDKTFGLLVASCLGAPVPRTRVISRRVAPFEFGQPTGSGEWWLRTAPSVQMPGKFTTVPRWVDPYDLLQKEDPECQIAAVLSQEGVTPVFAGATGLSSAGDAVVEGVAGSGDSFMLGDMSPEPLPAEVLSSVIERLRSLALQIGPVRVEWVYDGDTVWIVQMHRATIGLPVGILSPGDADEWVDFDPQDGLDALRALVQAIGSLSIGVNVTRAVGVTSHVGDLLRHASIPARFAISNV